MKIKRISIYQEFRCVGADCPVNCCKGWKVPLDDAIYEKYRKEKGILGFLLRLSVRKEDGLTIFRNRCGKCPFWGKDRLCRIQKKHGEEYLPWICIQFPRQLYNLGFFCEETLYLACPEAARLFLEHAKQGKHFTFEETEGEAAYKVNTTNDDENFLEYLLRAREQLIEMLAAGCRFDSMAVLYYGRDAQKACLEGKNLPSPSAYEEFCDKRYTMDCTVLNDLFFNDFYQPGLIMHSPFLHRLCIKYIREFGILSQINIQAANRKLAALREDLYRKIPEIDTLLDKYYEYYLQTGFLEIFEDYSFSKNLIYGMAKANMLWVLIALFAENRESVTNDQIAKIIAVFERRAHRIKDGLPA